MKSFEWNKEVDNFIWISYRFHIPCEEEGWGGGGGDGWSAESTQTIQQILALLQTVVAVIAIIKF